MGLSNLSVFRECIKRKMEGKTFANLLEQQVAFRQASKECSEELRKLTPCERINEEIDMLTFDLVEKRKMLPEMLSQKELLELLGLEREWALKKCNC